MISQKNAEFRRLLERAGFSLQTITPLDEETFVIESAAK
jgi:hypothetical protein